MADLEQALLMQAPPRGPKWIFRYGEPETPPLPSRLWLFGMYVVTQPRYGYDIRAFTHAHSTKFTPPGKFKVRK